MQIGELSWFCEPLTDTSNLERLWTELEGRSDCSFFLTWDWIGNWLSETPDLSPLEVSVYDGTVIVALALFQPRELRRRFGKSKALLLHQSGVPSQDTITIEYNGILSDRRYSQRVEADLFYFLTKSEAFDIGRRVHIALGTDAIADHARKTGLAVHELARMPSWFVDLTTVRNSERDYLDFLSPNTRHQIRRSMQIYRQRGPLQATAARFTGEALTFLDQLKRLHQETWTNRGLAGSFANSYFEHFHQALIRRCIERGTVEIIRVTAGDQTIAQVYNFNRNGHIYAYLTGLSYEHNPKLKPGLIAHCMCIDRHLKMGAAVYDFMGGNARYKASLGTRGPDLGHYVIERKTIFSLGFALARRLKSRLRKNSNVAYEIAQKVL